VTPDIRMKNQGRSPSNSLFFYTSLLLQDLFKNLW